VWIQPRKRTTLQMPTSFSLRKAASRRPLERGRLEPPGSLAQGTFSKGFSRNLGGLPLSVVETLGRLVQGKPEGQPTWR